MTARMSLPMRGAWIEMWAELKRLNDGVMSLPMRGAWIEIERIDAPRGRGAGRSPCGERGLKYSIDADLAVTCGVAPHAGSVD